MDSRGNLLDGPRSEWQEFARNFPVVFWGGVGSMADIGVKENVKRVFYVRFLNHPIYLDLIAQRPEIRLDKLENDSPDTMTVPVIGSAHAYQVSSARDELTW